MRVPPKINVITRGPFPSELVLSTAPISSSASCGKLGKLGTSQDFLLCVTFWASGGGASFGSETCRARLTPRPFVPKQHGRKRRATWPRPKVAGASFLQHSKRETGVLIGTKGLSGFGNDSTHYPHACRRHHDRAVTGLWLASLHDGKRGTSQISHGASLYVRQRALLE